MLSSAQAVGTTLAAVVTVAIFLFAVTRRPVIMRVAPYVLALGVIGAAIYAEVPFERTSTQNRKLVAGDVVDAAAEVQAAPAPVRHSTGELRGINHTASGGVSIVESTDGRFVVRFENFTVQGAPAPVLYVIEGDDKRSPGGTDLGAFTATDGTTLDVALPAGIEPGPGWTVLIWCEKFATPIANATQR